MFAICSLHIHKNKSAPKKKGEDGAESKSWADIDRYKRICSDLSINSQTSLQHAHTWGFAEPSVRTRNRYWLSANLPTSNWIITDWLWRTNATKYKFYLNELNDNWNGHVFTLTFTEKPTKASTKTWGKRGQRIDWDVYLGRFWTTAEWFFNFLFLLFDVVPNDDGMWSRVINEILDSD